MKDLKELSRLQYSVTQEGATEPPFDNEFDQHFEEGLYLDIVSGDVLFSSIDKFDSGCGWPAFSAPVERKAISELLDKSHGATRVEVRGKQADTHLGHVFTDGPTPKGLRYCINSASLEFIPKAKLKEKGLGSYLDLFYETACFGAGCFWGVESLFLRLPGVVHSISGYMGGELSNPSYQDICTGETGHAEVVRIIYDKDIVSFSELTNYFWRLHDPTTLNFQGPDHGTQYRSVIFFYNEQQQRLAKDSMELRDKTGLHEGPIVTEIAKAEIFYPAEEYHQDYYNKKYQGQNGQICHFLKDE